MPGERPPAPWGSFPLVELSVLVGIILVILGFAIGGARAPVMVLAGLMVASVAGLELSVREHFAGYRSHTLLLSGTVSLAILLAVALVAPSVYRPAALAIALVAFGVAAWALTRAFRRRAGVAFKLR